METTEREYFRIPEGNMDLLKAKIDKLNKKALKLSCPEVTISVVGEEIVNLKKFKNDPDEWVKYFHLILNGQAPIISGWIFVATLQHESNGNVIRAIRHLSEEGPNPQVPERYRTAEPACEHCNTKRRRTRSLIVHNPETGEFKQVGDGCLKDFLGHPNPEYYAKYLEMILNLDDEMELFTSTGPGRNPRYIPLVEYLSWVASCIRISGWVSRKTAEEYHKYATSSRAFEYMNPNPHLLWKDPKYREEIELHRPTNEDLEMVQKVITWVREEVTPRPEKSDYLHNLSVVIGQDYIAGKSTGIAASVISAYKREIEIREEKAQKEQKPGSNWIGTVDQRITVEVTVTNIIVIDTGYGLKNLYKMETSNYEVLVWFTKNEVMEEGKAYTLTGKVKEHKEYRGKKETVLTRCKVQ